MFFHVVSPNIALTFPTNTELVGCLEGGEQKILAQVSKGIHFLD